MDHENYIHRTIELAKKGIGHVSPNPRVGAVIVKNDTIIAEGYHSKFGGPHAEISALRQLSEEQSKEAVLYVNLEPCAHHGKTPPCVHAIIAAKIKTVIFGMKDPNPMVAGKGLKILRNSGIQVIGPVLEEECIELNKGFIKSILKGIPWITMKIAQTLDGRIALNNGQSRWITSENSRKLVHQWRSEHDAVLVGIGTIMQDDPRLNVRLIEGPQPIRIVLDSHLRISFNAKLVKNDPERLWIITSNHADPVKKRRFQDVGIKLFETSQSNEYLNLVPVWKKLIDEGVCSIFIEGGQKVFSSFLNADLVDQLYVFIAPKIFGQGISAIDGLETSQPEQAFQFPFFSWNITGTDMLFKGIRTCLQDLLKK